MKSLSLSLSLSRRLWLPTLLVVGVILVMAVVISLRTQAQIALTQAALQTQLEKVERATEWAGLTEVNAARAMAALTSSDPELGNRLKADMDATSAKITRIQKAIEAIATTPEESAALGRVAEARKTYLEQRRQVLAARGDAPAVPDDQLQAVRSRLASYLESQRAVVALTHQQAEQLASQTAHQRQMTMYMVVAVMLAMAAVLVLTTTLSTRSIVQPIKDALAATDRIASGDLTSQLDTPRGDEIGDLLRGLDRMNGALRQLVSEVRSGAAGMQIASAEIATGNADLSSRTEQTASSLQATAGSMTQLTSTVQQSAEAAAQANQLASSAADAAVRGGEVVGQVVSNMDEIATSSRKIGDIIGVIDGIAFQTNILALNAAVEAARAGEQGRGFAVVAGEVRALAQRSAGAAREIKSLIGASMDTVEQGSKLVQDAGVTMTDLVASVRRVTDIIGEISASAHEQNDGIRQVNQAVTRLDEMTQQNAALVEQSAAAADSLREQAQRLNAQVQKFDVGSAKAAAAAPVVRPALVAPAPAPQAARLARPSRPPVVAAASAAATAAPTRAPAPAAATAPSDEWETF
jgi:methyl-accepting chemotaxis protein